MLCAWKALQSEAMVTGYAVPGKVRRERRAWKALRHRTCPKHPPLHCISEIRATEQVAIFPIEKEKFVSIRAIRGHIKISRGQQKIRALYANFSPEKPVNPALIPLIT